MSDRAVYFFLRPQGPPEDSAYQHCALALAEGFHSLGLPCYANQPYWQLGGDPPFRCNAEVRPEDCDVVVWGDNYPLDLEPELGVFRGGPKTIYLDSADGWRAQAESARYRRFDLVLRTHCNSRYRYPSNVRPWAFGLTERILAACQKVVDHGAREAVAIVNFRVGHPVRRVAERRILPLIARRFTVDRELDEPPTPDSGLDRLYWEATGRRHYPGFFDRLGRSQACAAFGGFFAPGLGGTTERLSERVLYNLASRLGLSTSTVMQYDSWRFWESMAAGCLTLQVDYERYGCRLPVQPQAAVHYCGIEFGRKDSECWIVDSETAKLESVAAAGRAWALEHYSPRAAATRLLNLLA